jgi:hypothetical protein
MLTLAQLGNLEDEDYDSIGYNTTTQSLTSSVNEYIVENGMHLLHSATSLHCEISLIALLAELLLHSVYVAQNVVV